MRMVVYALRSFKRTDTEAPRLSLTRLGIDGTSGPTLELLGAMTRSKTNTRRLCIVISTVSDAQSSSPCVVATCSRNTDTSSIHELQVASRLPFFPAEGPDGSVVVSAGGIAQEPGETGVWRTRYGKRRTRVGVRPAEGVVGEEDVEGCSRRQQ